MAKNVGKIFENNFKASVPKEYWLHRPTDAAQAFDISSESSKSSKLRFSKKSPCDFMLFDGEVLFTPELKSFMGSCSFERTKKDKGTIHYYQIDTLKEYSGHKNVVAGLILDFRTSDNTYFLDIKQWDNLIDNIPKKSFNEKDLLKWCTPILIEKRKLRVNYRYDVEKLFEDIKRS